MKECNIAVIGLGKMGLLHASLLSSIPGVRLSALCDNKKLLAKMAKSLFGAKISVVTDVNALSGLDLDGVIITTPIQSHFSIISTVLENKIAENIFTEKTLAFNYIDSQKLCQSAKIVNGVNMVGYQKRYCVTFMKAKELLNSNVIGTLTNFTAYSFSSDFVGLGKEELSQVSASRGGVLRDLGAHAINLSMWYLGDLSVESIKFANTAYDKNGSCSLNVATSEGLHGTIEASWVKEGFRMPDTGLRFEGSNGSLFVNDDKVSVLDKKGQTVETWYRQNLDDNVPFLLWAPEYYRQDFHFVRCIMDDCSPASDFSEALKVDRLISGAAE